MMEVSMVGSSDESSEMAILKCQPCFRDSTEVKAKVFCLNCKHCASHHIGVEPFRNHVLKELDETPSPHDNSSDFIDDDVVDEPKKSCPKRMSECTMEPPTNRYPWKSETPRNCMVPVKHDEEPLTPDICSDFTDTGVLDNIKDSCPKLMKECIEEPNQTGTPENLKSIETEQLCKSRRSSVLFRLKNLGKNRNPFTLLTGRISSNRPV